jgi:hypothetical protein
MKRENPANFWYLPMGSLQRSNNQLFGGGTAVVDAIKIFGFGSDCWVKGKGKDMVRGGRASITL